MGDTPTTHNVVRRLVELSGLLDKATAEIAQLDEEAVKAKSTFEVTFARAFLTREGSVDARKQQATLDSAMESFTSEIAAAKVRACRERLRTIRDQIEIGRSLNSAVKSEWSASAIGQV